MDIQQKEQEEKKIINLCLQLMKIYSKIGDWRIKQNDAWDKLANIWDFDDYNKLNEYIIIKQYSQSQREYIEKRWFSYSLAKCDEYLFYSHSGVTPNPNSKSWEWDIKFENKNNLEYDIKSTRIITDIYGDLTDYEKILKHISNPEILARLYYIRQSNGIRENYQNRIFVVHCPLEERNETFLKTRFKTKNKIISEYIKYFTNVNTKPLILEPFQVNSKGCKKIISGVYYDIIFIVEMEDGSIGYQFASNPIKELMKIELKEKMTELV